MPFRAVQLGLDWLTEAAAALLWPPRCCACDRLGAEPFCAACADTLMLAEVGCPRCGQPVDAAPDRPRRCPPCRQSPPSFRLARAPYLHGGALAEAIHRLKYEGRFELGRSLGILFAATESPQADLLVPIPLHRQRLRERGYDQAALLAASASWAFGLPVRHALSRIRSTRPQVGLRRAERGRNLVGAFRAHPRVAGLRVCLIDDVLTTGATAEAAARALLLAGSRSVEVRALARAELQLG